MPISLPPTGGEPDPGVLLEMVAIVAILLALFLASVWAFIW